MIRPFYQNDLITLYHGDAREIIPKLGPVDVIYTDPVWPDCEKIFPGVDAWKMFSETAQFFPAMGCKRVMITLGVDSDPRFLQGIPKEIPFFRCCWLEFLRPRYRGTILAGNDVVYIFGTAHRSCGWTRVMPGRYVQTHSGHRKCDHPAPRNDEHAAWVISNFVDLDETILDPFSGSGTFLIAAFRAGRKSIGIEIEERWCEDSVKRIKNEIGLLIKMKQSPVAGEGGGK